MASPTKRVIVVGSSGVGKTSMVSALTENSYQPINMFDPSSKPVMPMQNVSRSDINYEFITIEDPFNVINRKANEEHVRHYFAQVIEQITNGLCLILYVFHSGTVHQDCLDIYNLFVDILCEKQLPVVGVVTYCENEDPMETYADCNRNSYERNGMNFAKVISTCFVRNGVLGRVCKNLREESTQHVWEMIDSYSLKSNIIVSYTRHQSVNETAEHPQRSLLNYLREGLLKWKKDESEQVSTQPKTSQSASASYQAATDRSEYTTLSTSGVIQRPTSGSNGYDNVARNSPQPMIHCMTQLTDNGTLLVGVYKEKINQWFGRRYQDFRLIFKATSNDFQIRTFHEQCDGKGSTITLIQTTPKYVFGGFTRIPWSSKKDKFHDGEAVLFTLNNPYGIPATLYKTKAKVGHYNIFHDPKMGPIFGKDPSDMVVTVDKYNIPIVVNHFPRSFDDSTFRGCATFAGDADIHISVIEVYECIPHQPTNN